MIGVIIMTALQAASPEVVVSGHRLDDAYAECLAGRCTPLRDAQVSISKAEQLVRDGDYVNAKRLLAKATRRNRSHAATDPKPVAALYEAYATVSWQEGDRSTFRSAVSEQVRTIRAHLPPDDPAVADSGIVLGDMWTKLGEWQTADGILAATERNARAQGQEFVAVSAAVRRAWLAAIQRQPGQARQIVAGIDQSPLARDPGIKAVLSVVRLRVAIDEKDDDQIDRLATAIAGQDQTGAPRLLWSPKLKPTAAQAASLASRRGGERDRNQPTSSEVGGIRWADIGFWVRPDGRTDHVEVLRGTRDSGWAQRITTMIAGRRYAALAGTAAQQGVYRIERYTIRGEYMRPIGSLITRRSGVPSVEMLDLTDGSKKPTPVT